MFPLPHDSATARSELRATWVPVVVHRMGMYKLKGVEAPVPVVQVGHVWWWRS